MGNHWNKLTLFLIFISALQISCDKNTGFMEIPVAPIPKINMDQFFTTSTKDLTIKAHLSNAARASSFIIDYGFLISDTPFEGFVGADRISLGNSFEGSGNFSTHLSPLMDRFYYTRAYVSYEDDEHFFTDISVINTQPGRWVEKAPFPGDGKIGATSFVIDGKAYVAGGQSDELWMYDPATDTWSQKASSPKPLNNPVNFVIGNKAFIGTNIHGIEQNRLPDFWSYDPVRDEWKEIASPSEFKGSITVNPIAFSIRGRGYIECNFNLLLEYNPISDAWDYAPPLELFQFDRSNAIAITNGDSVLVIGGVDATDDYREDVQLYSGRANSWELKNNFPQSPNLGIEQGRTGGVGFAINGNFYAGMGEADSRLSHADLYVYIPRHDLWAANSTIPTLINEPLGIQQAVGFSIENTGYIGLGRRSWREGAQDFSTLNLRFWAFEAE